MEIPYITPDVLKRIGISAGVFTFGFISFFFLTDIPTASTFGVILSLLGAAVVMNIFSLEFDRFDVLLTSGLMIPVFFILEYLAFVDLYSIVGILIISLKDISLYAGFSIITGTLVLYRMNPEKRMKLAKESEEKRVKKEKVFYVPEKPKEVAKPDVSLITGGKPGKKTLSALEELDKELEKEVPEEPKKELAPELEKAAFKVHSLIIKGKGKDDILGILMKAGFSKKEAQQIFDYASEL
jgi:hypothetical protein